MLNLSSQNQSVANIKHLSLSYKIFQKAMDESYPGVISSTPAQTEVPNSHNILLKKRMFGRYSAQLDFSLIVLFQTNLICTDQQKVLDTSWIEAQRRERNM